MLFLIQRGNFDEETNTCERTAVRTFKEKS